MVTGYKTNNDSKTQLMPTVTICMVITGIRNILGWWGTLNNCEVEKYNDGKVRFEPLNRARFGRMVGKKGEI